MFETILVPVDGSDNAFKALDMAIDLHKVHGSKIIILTVFRHHSLLEASMSMVRPEEPENLDDSMREYAAEIVEHAKNYAKTKGVDSVRGFVKRGPTARTIVKFAAERDADIIVLGGRGLGDIEGYLLGSVSHKVTGIAERPVLVV